MRILFFFFLASVSWLTVAAQTNAQIDSVINIMCVELGNAKNLPDTARLSKMFNRIGPDFEKKFPSSKVEFRNYPNADSYYMHVEGKITSIGVESKFLDDNNHPELSVDMLGIICICKRTA